MTIQRQVPSKRALANSVLHALPGKPKVIGYAGTERGLCRSNYSTRRDAWLSENTTSEAIAVTCEGKKQALGVVDWFRAKRCCQGRKKCDVEISS